MALKRVPFKLTFVGKPALLVRGDGVVSGTVRYPAQKIAPKPAQSDAVRASAEKAKVKAEAYRKLLELVIEAEKEYRLSLIEAARHVVRSNGRKLSEVAGSTAQSLAESIVAARRK